MGNNTVTISMEQYEFFIGLEVRCDVLKDYTISSEYNIDRKMIANILGFEIPAKGTGNE